MSAPFKECGCGHTIVTVDDWRALPLVGVWDTGEGVLELRSDSCGSTLATELSSGAGE